MTSSLASKTDRSLRHLRWSKETEGWGGDDEIALTEIDPDLPARVEWVEGVGNRWQVWVFEESADVVGDDILIAQDLDLALRVDRVGEFARLDGEFHHYEIIGEEHEHSVAQLLGQLP